MPFLYYCPFCFDVHLCKPGFPAEERSFGEVCERDSNSSWPGINQHCGDQFLQVAYIRFVHRGCAAAVGSCVDIEEPVPGNLLSCVPYYPDPFIACKWYAGWDATGRAGDLV